MLADKLVECWEVNLAEEGTTENAGKFKSKYYQGYLTECSISSEAEGVVEVSFDIWSEWKWSRWICISN